jgi:hypothetical protein
VNATHKEGRKKKTISTNTHTYTDNMQGKNRLLAGAQQRTVLPSLNPLYSCLSYNETKKKKRRGRRANKRKKGFTTISHTVKLKKEERSLPPKDVSGCTLVFFCLRERGSQQERGVTRPLLSFPLSQGKHHFQQNRASHTHTQEKQYTKLVLIKTSPTIIPPSTSLHLSLS